MKKNSFVTPRAKADLREIGRYIAKDNPVAAQNFIHKCYAQFQLIGEHPGIGHKREDLTTKPYLFMSMGSYMIAYTTKTKPPSILRVLSTYRDIAGLM